MLLLQLIHPSELFVKIREFIPWPGCFINVQRCGDMSMVLLQDPLESFVKRREYLPGSGFLSHRGMT